MINKGDFVIEGISVIETLPNAGTGLSAVFEESGQLKKKTIGSISMLPKESYLPGLSLAFPSIFNLNTTSLDYAHTDMTVSLASQLKGAVLMAPISMNGTPAFRKIVRSDLDLADVIFEDSPIFGNFVKKSGDTITSSLASPLTIVRTSATNNTIAYGTTAGTVYAGNADGLSFVVSDNANINSPTVKWLSVSAIGVSTRGQGGTNLQSRDLGGFYIDSSITNSRAEHVVRHNFTNRNVTFTLGGVSGSTGSMSQWGIHRYLNDRTTNGVDGFFGFMGDTDTIGASSLVGSGVRNVVALANGSLSTEPIVSQIQRLDLNDTTGYIGISNSNSVRLHSLVTTNKPDANASPITGGGLVVYSNTSGSVNYPNALGGGLSYNRIPNSFVGAIDIWTSSNTDSKVYIRTGKSTTEYHPYEIVATEPWVGLNTYNKQNLRALSVSQPYDPNNNPQILDGGHISNYGTVGWLTGGLIRDYGGIIAFRMHGTVYAGFEFNYGIGRNIPNGGRLAFRGVAGTSDTIDGANGGYKPWKEVWSSGDFTATDVANWRTSFGWGNPAGLYHSLSFNNPGVAVSYTGSLLAMPVGSYSAVISTSATNRPFVNTGGLISFGQLSGVTTRILGARDNSDNLWFQSGDGTGDWRQLATRDWVNTSGVYLPRAGGAMSQGANILFNNQLTAGASVFGTGSTSLGYGVWMGNNIQYDGEKFIQPRGAGVGSYAFTANFHKGFSFNYAAPNGTNGGEITLTEIVKIGSTGIITTLNNGTSEQWNQSFNWGNHATAGYSTQTLTSGANIQIVGNVISATDTTYSVFSTGVAGLVPARVGTVATKYLREDGAWVTPTNTTYSAGTLDQLNAGTVTTNYIWSPKILSDFVISKIPQVTQIFEKTAQGGLRVMDWDSISNREGSISIGRTASATKIGALAMMTGASSDGNDGIAIGPYSQVKKSKGISIGPYSSTNASEAASIGTGLINNQRGCTVVGRYNNPIMMEPMEEIIPVKSPVFIVGAGKSTNIRVNAYELYADGSSINFGAIKYNYGSIIDFSDELTVPHIKWIRENISGCGGGTISDPVALSGTNQVALNVTSMDFDERVEANDNRYGEVWEGQVIDSNANIGNLVEYIPSLKQWIAVIGSSFSAVSGSLLGIFIENTKVLVEGFYRPSNNSVLWSQIKDALGKDYFYFGVNPQTGNTNISFYDINDLEKNRTCGMIISTNQIHFNPGSYGRL